VISLDCETTGLDLYHGARPFLVTTCTDGGEQTTWEWDVDPKTRQPSIPPGDLEELANHVRANLEGGLVLHNAKFDFTALDSVGLWEMVDLDLAWSAVDDTLLAGHLLASNQPHNLTYMASHYVGIDIRPAEEAVKRAVQDCRKRVRLKANQELTAGWRVAKKDLPGNPSITNEAWAADMWLPRATAKALGLPTPADDCTHSWNREDLCDNCKGHRYHVVLCHYADVDSSVSVKLWRKLRGELHGRGLWEIYQQRRKLLPIAHAMERRGVTVNGCRIAEMQELYSEEADRAEQLCLGIATTLGKDLTLPKGGNNRSLTEFCFGEGGLGLPVLERTEGGAPSLNKNVMETYHTVLERGTKQHLFVSALNRKRKRDTAVSYLRAYERFMVSYLGDYYLLHPNLNPTGTDTLRWSSSNPNEQNISKRGIDVRCQLCQGGGCVACGETGWVSRNLRHAFGPAPDREWWSCDAKNLELRIPAYESGEQELIDLFERPDEPPYYGSTHLLNFHTVYPDIWDGELGKVCESKNCCNGEVVDHARIGPHCKKRFAEDWYQYCKNGGFAVQYGAIDRTDRLSTADRAFHRPGSHAKLKARFGRLEAHNQRCIRQAEKYGYVETIPDVSVDPRIGYPLMCTRTERGRILPTVPLNYRTQGSACWWMQQAMIRCHGLLCRWNTRGFSGYIVLQVHDELVFDFPRGGDPRNDLAKEKSGKPYFRTSNLWRIRELQKLMEQGGKDIGVPTPTSCEYHTESWAEGVTC
jgi:DNA polymerase I-like protein with 3'-5' exonuclease and polymerase domains